jgi:hypothetical protein
MRFLVFFVLFVGLQLPVVLADVQPAASSVLGSTSDLADASIAVPAVGGAATENFALRVFSMCIGILLLGVAAYMAFKSSAAPAKVYVKE